MKIKQKVNKLKEESEERNFTQSLDLVLNLKNIELDNPENRFSENLKLPNEVSEEVKICVIGDTLTKKVEDDDVKLIGNDELDEYAEDKKKAKELAQGIDFFIAEANLMAKIGKSLGPVLGPMNKMPQAMPPGEDPSGKISDLKSSTSIKLGEKPIIQCKVGYQEMDDEKLEENIKTVVNFIKDKLPSGEHQIKNVMIKLTMSSPIELEV